jgi:hypothetical protein
MQSTWPIYSQEGLGRRVDRPDGEILSVRFVSVVTGVWSGLRNKSKENSDGTDQRLPSDFWMLAGTIPGAQMAEPMRDA